MVRPVAGNLPEQVKNNQSVNTAAGNGGQKMSQYSWFTVYFVLAKCLQIWHLTRIYVLPDCCQRDRAERLCFCVVGVKILAEEGGVRFYCQNT